MSTMTSDELVETTLQQRAELYRFLGNAFLNEVDIETLDTLAAVDETAGVDETIEELDVEPEPLDGSAQLKAFRDEISELDDEELESMREDLAGTYGRLFHIDRRESVDPYESVYQDGGHKMYQESYTKVKKIMDELGYTGYQNHSEPADHIGFELDFMAYLNDAALRDFREGNVEYADRYMNLQAEFVEKHIGKWAPTLCQEITGNTESEFYEAIAAMAWELVEREPEMIEALRGELTR